MVGFYLVHVCDAVGCRVIWRVQLAAGCSLFPVQTDGSPLLSTLKNPTSKQDILTPKLWDLELFSHPNMNKNKILFSFRI